MFQRLSSEIGFDEVNITRLCHIIVVREPRVKRLSDFWGVLIAFQKRIGIRQIVQNDRSVSLVSVTQFNVEKTRAREGNSVVERVDNLAQLCRGSRGCVVAKALPVGKTNVVTQQV